jgi:hypothetical protein
MQDFKLHFAANSQPDCHTLRENERRHQRASRKQYSSHTYASRVVSFCLQQHQVAAQMQKNFIQVVRSLSRVTQPGRLADVYLKLIIDMKGTCKRQPLCACLNVTIRSGRMRRGLDYQYKVAKKSR